MTIKTIFFTTQDKIFVLHNFSIQSNYYRIKTHTMQISFTLSRYENYRFNNNRYKKKTYFALKRKTSLDGYEWKFNSCL